MTESATIEKQRGICENAGSADLGIWRSRLHYFLTPIQRILKFVLFKNAANMLGKCPICTVDPLKTLRLTRILAALPVGAKTTIPKISRATELPFSVINHDLRFLADVLKLPIKQDRSYVLLVGKIPFCCRCKQIVEQFRVLPRPGVCGFKGGELGKTTHSPPL